MTALSPEYGVIQPEFWRMFFIHLFSTFSQSYVIFAFGYSNLNGYYNNSLAKDWAVRRFSHQ